MAVDISVDIKGIEQYFQNSDKLIRQFGETPNNPLFKETKDFVKPFAAQVRSATPVDKGITRKTVRSEVRFSKRTGAIIAQVGWFFKGRYRNEVGRIIATRTLERDKGVLRRIAMGSANTFRTRLTKAAQIEADKIIGD